MSHSNTSVLSGLVTLIRPRQWVKNCFVLAPLIFSGHFLDVPSLINSAVVFFLFCVASSASYIVNDMRDIEYDRKHPVKSHKRPLATGAITLFHARMLLAILYLVLVAGYFYSPSVLLVISGYLALNLAYTFYLKHQPVIDIFTIAIGFVLRVIAGTVALSLETSSWMLVTTLCLALYLAAVKRRQELAINGSDGRKVLEHYTVELVDKYAEMSAMGALVFYGLFVMTVRPEMVITIPFVLFGLFRYWFVVEILDSGESPTDALLSDWQLAVNLILWISATIWAIWPASV